jgi:multidrug efflux system outer membrane protein
MNRYLIALLIGAFFAGGCALAPPYERPEAPVPSAWPDGPAYEKIRSVPDAAGAAGIAWRHFFTDERLQKVIETALDNNRDLRLAALNVQRARAVYGIQRSALFPEVSAVANGSKQRIPADLSSSGEAVTAERYDVNLGIFEWEIDFFGRIRSLKDQALETFLATEQARRSAQILMVSAVADTYLTLVADRENLNLAEATYKTQKYTYGLIKQRCAVGLGSELDLNRAQTQVDIARGDMARYTQLAARDENALRLLVGTSLPLPTTEMPADLAHIEPFEKVFAGISSEVLLSRPDILRAEYLLKAAHANIGAARAALFPRVSLTTAVGAASSDLSGLFDAGSDTWLFAPQVTLPVFDARLWSALDVTKTEREIVLVQYEKAIQSAFREVADTLAVQGTVGLRLSAQQSLVGSAAATYRLSKARYDKGIDSYLSVLDAQRALFAARQGLVALRLAELANQVRLYAVLGGGGE